MRAKVVKKLRKIAKDIAKEKGWPLRDYTITMQREIVLKKESERGFYQFLKGKHKNGN